MLNNFVYVVCDDRNTYEVRFRTSVREFVKDKDTIDNLGYEIVKCFRINNGLFGPIMGFCQDYIGGQISLGDLESQVISLQDNR